MSDVDTPVLIKYCYSFIVMMIFYSLPTLDSVKLVNNQSSLPTQASNNTTALPTLRPSLFLAPIPSLPPTIISTASSPIVATTTSSPTSLSPTLSPTVSSPPTVTPSSSPVCLDEHDYCAYWASVDECENSQAYMLKSCRKSCGTCKPQLENNKEPTLSSIVSSPPTVIPSSSPTLSPTVSRGPTLSSSPTSSPTITFLPIEGSTCSDTCGSERELMNNNNIQKRILEYIDEGKMKNIHCLDTSKITNMNYLLSGNSNYGGDVRFQSFNNDLSCWNVSSVTNMRVST